MTAFGVGGSARAVGEWDTRFIGSRIRATDTKTFTFERPADLAYAPGQFFFVLLQTGGAHPIEHHFSFSSSPTEPTIEFTTRMTGHEYKNRLEQLQPGDIVHVAGPDGAFMLSPQMRKVAFLCGGIGITPARSVVRWAYDSGAELDITVVHGDHDSNSRAFREEFSALDSHRIRVVAVLSDPESGWTGRRGHIDAAVVSEEVSDWRDRDFFVSGPALMVDSVVRVLVEQVGVSPTRIMSEHFPGYASST